MIELEQYKQEINSYTDRVKELAASFKIEDKESRVAEIEKEMEKADFWDDNQRSQNMMKELKGLKSSLNEIKGLQDSFDEIVMTIEMAEEDDSFVSAEELREQIDEFIGEFDRVKIAALLSDEYDENDAVIKINAGAGGTESCDWASMLYRMYTRYAESHGFTHEVIDFLDGDEAGIKSITFMVKGLNAYGYLKSEKGVHRLVRISPFNAQGKRQTSFTSVEVMPEIEEDLDVEINDDEIRVDTYRASGAGGQHVNKTSSAIRITHLPTGIVVQCQNERSQTKNKDMAMKMLKSQLYLRKKEEEAAKRDDIRGEVKEIGWGNQIRSYVMQPYTLVKDHRTKCECGNIQAVMDGDIDQFIESYLKAKWNGTVSEDAGEDDDL